MVWTNRFRKILIPKTQFKCQQDVTIIDELKEIRTVNKFLLEERMSSQIDSNTILSIDFKDAFRSISHRWFNLVMRRLKIPEPFIDWIWMMYTFMF